MSQDNYFPSDICLKTCYAIMSKNAQLLSICLKDDRFDINEHFPSMFSSNDNYLAYAINYDDDYAFNELLKSEKLILSASDKHHLYQLLKRKEKYRHLYRAMKRLDQKNTYPIEYLKYLFSSPSNNEKSDKVKKKHQ